MYSSREVAVQMIIPKEVGGIVGWRTRDRDGTLPADRRRQPFCCVHRSRPPRRWVAVDRDGVGDRDGAIVLADLHIGGVDPEIGPTALNRLAKSCGDQT